MAKQYLSSQEILFRCFEDKTGQLRTSNGPYALQDYLNAVFDENTNSLRISSAVNSIVVPSEQLSLLVAPEDGQIIKLITEDDELFAPAGLYFYDGDGWVCLNCKAPYAFGNLGATPSLSLIPGASYTATVDAEITSFTVAFTRPGLCSITLTNATEYAVAQPVMDGRTSKLLAEAAWDGAATALSKALLEDDGVYLVVSAGGLV